MAIGVPSFSIVSFHVNDLQPNLPYILTNLYVSSMRCNTNYQYYDATENRNDIFSFMFWVKQIITENISNSNCGHRKPWWRIGWSRSTCPALSYCTYIPGNHLHYVFVEKFVILFSLFPFQLVQNMIRCQLMQNIKATIIDCEELIFYRP